MVRHCRRLIKYVDKNKINAIRSSLSPFPSSTKLFRIYISTGSNSFCEMAFTRTYFRFFILILAAAAFVSVLLSNLSILFPVSLPGSLFDASHKRPNSIGFYTADDSSAYLPSDDTQPILRAIEKLDSERNLSKRTSPAAESESSSESEDEQGNGEYKYVPGEKPAWYEKAILRGTHFNELMRANEGRAVEIDHRAKPRSWTEKDLEQYGWVLCIVPNSQNVNPTGHHTLYCNCESFFEDRSMGFSPSVTAYPPNVDFEINHSKSWKYPGAVNLKSGEQDLSEHQVSPTFSSSICMHHCRLNTNLYGRPLTRLTNLLIIITTVSLWQCTTRVQVIR